MQMGKRLVIAGFLVALIGMLLYCVASFSVDTNQQVASTLQAGTRWPVFASLGVVGVGAFLWFVGAIVHFKGGIDSDPSGPDLYF